MKYIFLMMISLPIFAASAPMPAAKPPVKESGDYIRVQDCSATTPMRGKKTYVCKKLKEEKKK